MNFHRLEKEVGRIGCKSKDRSLGETNGIVTTIVGRSNVEQLDLMGTILPHSDWCARAK